MELFFELIQVALGIRNELSRVLTVDEWKQIYQESQRQAVIGVTVEGIDKLPQEQRPSQVMVLEWIGAAEIIRKRNKILNQRCVEIQLLFAQAGFRSCILKGQGNATMYPNPYSRMPGDIDIWVDGERDAIIDFVKGFAPAANIKYKDIAFHYKDVDVEAHFFPAYLNNFKYNKRFQQFISRNKAKQFEHLTEFENAKIYTPTDDFNIIYQMAHLYHHFFCEGIGMRHFIDYYYLLKKVNGKALYIDFSQFGMQRFAEGVMWVEKELLGLPETLLIAKPNAKVGKVLMNEIILYGNFGNFKNLNKTVRQVKWGNTLRPIKYLNVFPRDSFDRLLFNLWWRCRSFCFMR